MDYLLQHMHSPAACTPQTQRPRLLIIWEMKCFVLSREMYPQVNCLLVKVHYCSTQSAPITRQPWEDDLYANQRIISQATAIGQIGGFKMMDNLSYRGWLGLRLHKLLCHWCVVSARLHARLRSRGTCIQDGLSCTLVKTSVNSQAIFTETSCFCCLTYFSVSIGYFTKRSCLSLSVISQTILTETYCFFMCNIQNCDFPNFPVF